MNVVKVSVVTVCLNARNTLRLTMESVARQRLIEVEHVIIDGGSKDGSQQIVKEYPVGYFVSEKDNGVYDAMEKGSRAVTGDIVIFLNAGDVFYDDYTCATVARFFDQNNADIVFGNLLPVYLKSTDTHDHGAFLAGKLLDLGYVRNRRQLFDESIHHQATFYRRWVLRKCSFKCQKVPTASGEYNLLLNAVMKKGARVKHIPVPVSRFVLGGISTRDFKLEWDKYVKARDALRSLYCPTKEAIKVESETEFCAVAPERTARQFLTKSGAKQVIRRSILFRIYDRILISFTARIFNSLIPRISDLLEMQVQRVFNDLTAVNHRTLGVLEEHLDQRVLHINNLLERCHDQQVIARIASISDKQESLSLEVSMQCAAAEQRITSIVEGMSQRYETLVREALSQMTSFEQRITANVASLIGGQTGRIQDASRQISISNIGLANIATTVNQGKDFSSQGFKVYSQWNEDGLIQYLVANCKAIKKTFVEIGVGDYTEANTRLLLEKDNWSGVIVDSSVANIQSVKDSELYWRYSLLAIDRFVDIDNINALLVDNGVKGEIGLLSIDIDGVDYWLWKAIDAISPQIVICEYNGIFGDCAKVTVPYDPEFDRTKKHYSWLFAGASLAALEHLGHEKGYTLVGTNGGGNNAFFLRNDVFSESSVVAPQKKYTRPMFRESRSPDGELTYLDISEGLRLIEEMEVFDVGRQCLVKIKDLTLSDEAKFS